MCHLLKEKTFEFCTKYRWSAASPTYPRHWLKMAIICCPWRSANMSESTLSRFFSILGVWEQFQHHLDLVPSLVTDRMGTRHGCHGAKNKSLQVRHSSAAVKFSVTFKLSRTNGNYLEWRAISPGQCAKTWADLSSGPQVNAACPRWIMVTQGFFFPKQCGHTWSSYGRS